MSESIKGVENVCVGGCVRKLNRMAKRAEEIADGLEHP